MTLFICTKCQGIDSVEIAYATAPIHPVQSYFKTDLKCTECKTGRWHGHFEKITFDPIRDRDLSLINRCVYIPVSESVVSLS